MQNCYPMLYMISYGSPYTYLYIYVNPYLGYSHIDFFSFVGAKLQKNIYICTNYFY